MKSSVSLAWIPGLLLALAWLPGGLAQNETTAPQTSATTSATAAATPAPSTPSKQPLPSKLRLSPWTLEIVKLAEAGIREDVILSFIDNSGTFNLGADQIIHLNDLGISSQIIHAMLQHDNEVVSGVRTLTISSDPDTGPAFGITLVSGGAPATRPGAQPRTAAIPSTPNTPESDATPNENPPTEARQTVTEAPSAAFHYAVSGQFDSVRPAALNLEKEPAKKKPTRYPVREPYPVELTAPIWVFTGEERTPNTLIIVGFPPSTH